MAEFRYSTRGEPGTWRWAFPKDKKIRLLVCPRCGLTARVDHEFFEGKIKSPVRCPVLNCDFHEECTYRPEPKRG